MAARGEKSEADSPGGIGADSSDPIEDLRGAPGAEDEDGRPIWAVQEPRSRRGTGGESRSGKGGRHPRCSQPPRPSPQKPFAPRPSRQEVERRIAEAQLWIAQRLPLIEIRDNAARNWGITNTKTVGRYLSLARQRMVEELVQNRLEHQAAYIEGLSELIRRSMAAEQFNAAVGAYRVMAEVTGMLRAPLKAPEPRP
jgi:hypothetical protein